MHNVTAIRNRRQQNEDLLKQLPALPKDAAFKLWKVGSVILPHPFVIGPEHLGNGIVTTEKPCHECRQPADEHVEHKTLFILVPQNRDLNAIAGLHDYLLEVKGKPELGIEGFAFPASKPRHVTAWINRRESGGSAMCPPDHPNYLGALECKGSGFCSLESVIEDEDGWFSDYLPDNIQEEIRRMFETWEREKPPLDHPRTVAWMADIYSHFARCYKDDQAKAEPWEYGKPATLIYPVPYYKLKHFTDDRRFSDEWREMAKAEVERANADTKANYAEVCIPENHAAVRYIREYYPEHQPRLDWIENPPESQGHWYARLQEKPTPENCPGEEGIGKHPVNGSWCQFCGWHAPKAA